MPSAASFITERDVQTWVNAAVGAALPPVMEESRAIFRQVMDDHQRILLHVTAEHLAVMREQGRAMNRVMMQMNKVIAIGGSTLLLAEYLKTNVS